MMDLFPLLSLKVAGDGRREYEGDCSVLLSSPSSHPILWLSFKAQKLGWVPIS